MTNKQKLHKLYAYRNILTYLQEEKQKSIEYQRELDKPKVLVLKRATY